MVLERQAIDLFLGNDGKWLGAKALLIQIVVELNQHDPLPMGGVRNIPQQR